MLRDVWLVIESVDLGWASRHEQLDHVLRLGGEMGRLRRQGRHSLFADLFRRCEERRIGQGSREPEGPEPRSNSPK